ncbi:MAG: molybdate ABC transporter substrate-binding protein [Chloroflexota bacterium]
MQRIFSKWPGWIITLLIFLLMGCAGNRSTDAGAQSQEITVFAASSLTDAFQALRETFEARNPDTRVILHFAGSSQLAAQLREGIPADVFASANSMQMQAVVDEGRVKAGTDKLFVSNQLAVIMPADNPSGIMTLVDLTKSGIQMVLASPNVPVRTYTDEFVAAMGKEFQTQFYNNLVSEEENVRQIVAKVALGEADVGVVYISDVTPDVVGRLQQLKIPDRQNVIATYPIAPLADTAHPELAQRFIDFTLSTTGQDILFRWGFGPPPTQIGQHEGTFTATLDTP